MATARQAPTVDLAAGRLVLDDTLPQAVAFTGKSMEELGWQRTGPNTLTVKMSAGAGDSDNYLLRLSFITGRDWPPSAQFVNPDTLDYAGDADLQHLPRLQSPEVHLHASYPAPSGKAIQLICCSATLEFYEILHDVQSHHVWRDSDTFMVTIDAIARAMRQHYHGPWNA